MSTDASGSVPVPPPGLNPTAVAPPPGLANGAIGTPTAPAGVRTCGVTISSHWLDWVPLGSLLLVFVLTFFPWVGSYPGGYALFTQSAWGLLSADMSVSPVTLAANEELKVAASALEKDVLTTDWLILPYLLLLFFTIFLAALERVFKNPDVMSVPGPLAWLPSIWPRRFLLLTCLTGFLLLLIGTDVLRGKGLESAINKIANTTFADEAAAADTNLKKQIVQIKVGQEVSRYALQGTTFRALVVWAHVAALLGMLGRWWLSRRGTKPNPRIVFEY